MFTMSEAAKQVGKTRQTIFKAIKSGRLSARKNDDGSYQIDPAELFRVYTQVTPVKSKQNEHERHVNQNKEVYIDIEKEILIAQLQAQIESRDKEISLQKSQIEDLKVQNKSLDQERREAQERFNNLLTDQSKKNEHEKPKKGLLGRIFG